MANKVATRDAFAAELVSVAASDHRICALDADLSVSTKTVLFHKAYPDRFFNAGIAEQNMIGMAAGLASCGKIPFVSTFAVFATGRAYDQIRLTVAYPHQNVKIAATHGGITVGEDGASHQALEDIALMRVLPGMTVLVPADGPAAEAAVRQAVAIDGPVYIRLGRPAVPVVYDQGFDRPPGTATVLTDGRDVAIAACGLMVQLALQAAEQLRAVGICARVLDMMSVKPLDEEQLERAAVECGAIVTAEEHSIIGGLGGAVAEFISAVHPVPVIRVGVNDTFGTSGTPDELMTAFGLDVQAIVRSCRRTLELK